VAFHIARITGGDRRITEDTGESHSMVTSFWESVGSGQANIIFGDPRKRFVVVRLGDRYRVFQPANLTGQPLWFSNNCHEDV
jgi:hypothetical protein